MNENEPKIGLVMQILLYAVFGLFDALQAVITLASAALVETGVALALEIIPPFIGIVGTFIMILWFALLPGHTRKFNEKLLTLLGMFVTEGIPFVDGAPGFSFAVHRMIKLSNSRPNTQNTQAAQALATTASQSRLVGALNAYKNLADQAMIKRLLSEQQEVDAKQKQQAKEVENQNAATQPSGVG